MEPEELITIDLDEVDGDNIDNDIDGWPDGFNPDHSLYYEN